MLPPASFPPLADPESLVRAMARVHRRLAADLTDRAADARVEPWLRDAHAGDKAAGRTGEPFETYRDAFCDQVAASWVLCTVFARNVEDRGYVPHRIAGPGAADRLAQFRVLFKFLGERDYLLHIFDAIALMPGGREVFGAGHAPLWWLWKREQSGRRIQYGMRPRVCGNRCQDFSPASPRSSSSGFWRGVCWRSREERFQPVRRIAWVRADLGAHRMHRACGLLLPRVIRCKSPQTMAGSASVNAPEIDVLVRDALGGNRTAQRRLLEDFLAPVVQARVSRTLLRRTACRGNARQEMMDLCQQVFVYFFADNVLARWDPARGSLATFAGVIADNHVRSILRSRIRSPFTEVATEPEAIERALADHRGHLEGEVGSRRALRRIEQELDDRELDDFYAFFIDEQSVEEMCIATGKSRDAVYKQRQRLRERVRAILEEDSPARAPRGVLQDEEQGP